MEQPPSKETRVPVNLRIKFRSETIEQFVERYAVDVSRGGIFIRTREPLAVGTQLKFDFQLQDTSPLMAGEGTVVWIREHDPNRAGVTPGMGVRFDKLTPASQPVLDKILTDKVKREPSGPNSAGASPTASATMSGKSGVSALPRRPSSTFSAVDPALLGVPAAGAPTAAGAAGSGPAGLSPGLPSKVTQPLASASPSSPARSSVSSPSLFKVPAAAAPAGGGGALPTSESQSALGRLATGPNLSTFGSTGGPLGSAPRTKSPVPLRPATGDSGRITGSGVPAVPTPLEDSERTQIADGLPEFATEQPTHVGGPTLGDLASSRAPAPAAGPIITATARRTLTPPPEHKLSLDGGPSAAASASAASSARTTAPDGSASVAADKPASAMPGRLSGSQPAVATGPGIGVGTPETDLARTVPASARISAIGPAVHTNTPHASPRIEVEKKRPMAKFIVVAVLLGGALAVIAAVKMSNREPAEAPASTTAANSATPAPAPTPPPAAVPAATPPATDPAAATAEGAKTEPAAGANPAAEPKPGEKPSEAAKAPEVAEPAAAAEAKPAEPKPVVAEPAPAGKTVRRPHPALHKKGAPAAEGDGAEAAAAGDAANVARVISLPTGAEVLIDGQSVGKTPFQGKDIDPAAPHALTVRKEGFETYEHMVSASDWLKGKGPGQSLRVTVKLRKNNGAGPAEGTDKKADKAAEPSPTEPAKTEPPAAESP